LSAAIGHDRDMYALILATALATHIAKNVDLIPGRFVPGSQPDGNTIVFTAPRGLIVIDTGRHPEHTNAILDFAKESKRPVAAVINTHWHLDHIGGNALVRRTYPNVRVYASSAFAEARTGFLANYRKQLEEAISTSKDPEQTKAWQAEIGLIDSGDALAPDEVITKSGTRDIAGRKLQIGLETRAATAGDVWVFDPSTRVLASGDLVTVPVPFLDTACPSGWSTALDHVAAVNFKTLIPGHGAPMTRADFEIYRTAFKNLLACSKPSKECVDGWMTDAAPLIKNENPKWLRGMTGYYVDEVLRGDPSHIAKLCGQ
jgi:glyoxylase-like metal-dependent hydrolase (beta-lactamase superfamily II)